MGKKKTAEVKVCKNEKCKRKFNLEKDDSGKWHKIGFDKGKIYIDGVESGF